jgi:hypothetical protein
MVLTPKIKLRTQLIFPANVYGRTGIDVSIENGNYFLDLDYSDFAPVSSLPTNPNLYVLVYDFIQKTYVLVPLSLMGSGGGLADAPVDGTLYGRLNAAWARGLPLAGGTLTGPLILAADPATALGAATKQYVDAHAGGIADAPNDGNVYGRKNLAWAIVPAGGGLTDAPSDSSFYGRLNAAWVKGLPLAGGTLTGPLILAANPTVALGAATKQYVDGLVVGPATVAPLMNGAAAVGVSLLYARQDHVHPTDTSRAPLASPALSGVPTAPTATPSTTNTTQIATTAFVQSAISGATAGVLSIGGQSGAITLNGGALASTILTTPRYDVAQSLTGPQQAQARGNIAAIGSIKRQVFTANGTYTPSAGMLYCIIETLGGGGAGGGAQSAAGANHAGGGGGAAGLSILLVGASAVGASQAVTIGAGGVGVAAGTGGNGGATTVGSLCGSVGGFGGTAGVNAASFGTPGPGGTIGTGDITGTGMPGGGGSIGSTAIFGPSGMGGSSIYGGGGASIVTSATVTGNAGTGHGAGGGGAFSYNAASAAAGGNGSPGIAIITEFCSQ